MRFARVLIAWRARDTSRFAVDSDVLSAAATSRYLQALHVPQDERDTPARRQQRKQAIETAQRQRAVEVRRLLRHVGQLPPGRERHPATYATPAQLDEHEPHGDRDEIGAQRRPVAQRRRAAEEGDEDLLQQILDGGVDPEVAPQHAPDDLGVPVPHDPERRRVAASDRFDQLGVAQSIAREARYRGLPRRGGATDRLKTGICGGGAFAPARVAEFGELGSQKTADGSEIRRRAPSSARLSE